MSIRKYLRKMARHNMEAEGIRHINKKPPRLTKDGKRTSKFAQEWREHI